MALRKLIQGTTLTALLYTSMCAPNVVTYLQDQMHINHIRNYVTSEIELKVAYELQEVADKRIQSFYIPFSYVPVTLSDIDLSEPITL